MIQNLLLDIWVLTCEMAPYLLLGFLLAGLMHTFIPRWVYARYLSGSGMKSVFLAALFGVPLPLCSCGVLPTAMGLRREGASKGATVSFLIATPQTGVDSIVATYSLMGLPFAIVRPIAAFVTAIFGGWMTNRWTEPSLNLTKESEETSCCKEEEKPIPFIERLKAGLHYAFVEMMGDVGKWLVIGLVVAGMITALVPDQWFEVFKDNSFLSILLVLAISVPMYVCATGSIPIAVALMMKGLTPGAGLVLLMAGPACNVASLLVIDKVLGRRTQMLYLLSIIAGAVAFALGIDYLLPGEWFTSTLHIEDGCCHEENIGWFNIVCTIALLLMVTYALIFHRDHDDCDCCDDECTTHEQTVMNVKGMNCSHCAANVERAIRSVEGVEDVSVSLNEKTAKIRGKFDHEAVKKAVKDLGYEIN
ncbi:MAG: SO_0444 family Cu/Zn efflux transporter [Bacteroidaceae bacterium]|nr:SO_0444 family Cu/Zn efflux transporter [Bacteroidaceae bacterium]